MANRVQQHNSNRGLMLVITACALVVALAAGVWLYRDYEAQKILNEQRVEVLKANVALLDAQMIFFDDVMAHVSQSSRSSIVDDSLYEMFKSARDPNEMPASTLACVRQSQKELNIMVGFAMIGASETDDQRNKFQSEYASCRTFIEKELQQLQR